MITYNAIQLYDMGFGPRTVSVSFPNCQGAIKQKDKGKAPAILTLSGWVPVDCRDPKYHCLDYETAKTWTNWIANVGFVVGDGYVVIDNDQGKLFSNVIASLLKNPLRKFVADVKHHRDSYFFRVVDFVGDGVPVVNQELKFRNGVQEATIQILAKGKQSVIFGTHPGTKMPYMWERELTSLDDIPVMSLASYENFLKELSEKLSGLGWSLKKTPSAATVSAVSAARAPVLTVTGITPQTVRDRIAEAKLFLGMIPNREIPAGETPNAIDQWLDDYANWLMVMYALRAFLGDVSLTPEAEACWCEWSDGRAQIEQTSESVWRSAVNNDVRYGARALLDIVRSLVPPEPDFPDIPPEDPMIKKTPTPIWDEIRERWVWSCWHGFIDTHTGLTCKSQQFAQNEAYRAKAFRDEVHAPKRMTSAASIFLHQRDRVGVFDITYAPGEGRFVPSIDPVLPNFNHWRPTTVVPSLVHEAQIAPWLEHLEFILGSKSERDRFLRWCAFVAQYPKFKPNWHYIIMSRQGLGKDTMVYPLKLAVGDGNWIEALSHELANNFTYVYEHKFLVISETGQSRHNAHGFNARIKPLLAQPPDYLPINKKNAHPYNIPNRGAVILFSNDVNPIYLEREQRRIHVVNRLAEKSKSLKYYRDLHDWLTAGGADLAAAFLLAYPLSDSEKGEFIGGVAPESDAKTELENQNLPPQLSALEELIADARQGITADTPYNLVATAQELAELLKRHGVQYATAQTVRTWLMEMERKQEGVSRLRVDPKEPHLCGVVSAVVKGVIYSGRLWLLDIVTPDKRLWNTLTTTDIVALWKNLGVQPTATVTTIHPKGNGAAKSFPDEDLV